MASHQGYFPALLCIQRRPHGRPLPMAGEWKHQVSFLDQNVQTDVLSPHFFSFHSLSADIWVPGGGRLGWKGPRSLNLWAAETCLYQEHTVMWTRNKILLYFSLFLVACFLQQQVSRPLVPYRIEQSRNIGHFDTLSSCPIFNSLPSPAALLPK